jgi:hypothetical protein
MTHQHAPRIFGLLVGILSSGAQASLTTITSQDIYLVKDNVTHYFWSSNANLLGTLESQQGYNTVVNAIIAANPVVGSNHVVYDTANSLDTQPNTGVYVLSSADFQPDGHANWFGAQAFINYLNKIDYAGSDKWQLPGAGANPQTGYNITSNDLGELYYNELNRVAWSTVINTYGILGDGSYQTAGPVGPFINAHTFKYWENQEFVDTKGVDQTPYSAWAFQADKGYQDNNTKVNQYYVWPEAPEQSFSLPLPGAQWLMLSGLLAVLGLKRKP